MPISRVTGNILEDHDGVVDDEPGGNRQRHERKVIDAVAHQIHRAAGSDQRYRNRDGGNQSGPHVAKKNEYDENHQPNRDCERTLHVLDGRTDGHGLIQHDAQFDRAIDGRHPLISRVSDWPPSVSGRAALIPSTVSIMLTPGCR